MDRTERFVGAEQVIRIGFWVNALLMIVKLSAGHFGNSEAVFADGVESAADFIAIVSVLIALRVGRRPFDGSHPYGHGRAESIAAIVVALVVFLGGTAILLRAVTTMMQGSFPKPALLTVLVAALTIVIKEYLYRYSITIGSRLESPALLALAADHRKDAITSIATLAGVTAAFFGFGIMDPAVAGLTALFIFRIGYQTFRSAAHDLMDGPPNGDLLVAIQALAEGVAGVEHVHGIRARRSGQFVLVDLKLDMDPAMTVKTSHAIASSVKQLIFSTFSNVGDVMIHVNPHDEQHEDLTRL